ncbi:MAG: glycosyltransferase family 39 protein [Acidobacteriota bacterium]|nr:glycosyltransferase family 39 protein [Acidobacteriota bacterium]
MSDGHQSEAILYSLTVFAIALGWRLCWILHGPWVHGDSAQYLSLAQSIALHGAFSFDGITLTAYRPPLYPALIALVWHGFRPPLMTIYALQAVLGACTAVFAYWIALPRFGRTPAVVAALLVALGPMSGRYVATVLTETLFTFLLVAGVLLWGRGRWIAAGAAFGLATLARAVLLPFVLLMVVAAVWPRWRRWRLVRDGSRAAIVALIVISPWLVRNTLLVDRPTVAQAGWTDNLIFGTVRLHVGENPWIELTSSATTGGDDNLPRPTSAPGVVRYVVHHPIDWLVARLSQYPRLFIDTGEYMLTGPHEPSASASGARRLESILLTVAFVAGNLAFLGLAVWGSLRARPLADTLHIWSFPAFLVLAQLPMYAEARYTLPLVPLLAVFAGAAIVSLWTGTGTETGAAAGLRIEAGEARGRR